MSTSILILKCQCGLWNDTRYDNECDCGKKIKEFGDICDGYDAIDVMTLNLNDAIEAIGRPNIQPVKNMTETCQYEDMDCDCSVCVDSTE